MGNNTWGVLIHTNLNSLKETKKVFELIQKDFFGAWWNKTIEEDGPSDWFEFIRFRKDFIGLSMVSEGCCAVSELSKICEKHNCELTDYED